MQYMPEEQLHRHCRAAVPDVDMRVLWASPDKTQVPPTCVHLQSSKNGQLDNSASVVDPGFERQKLSN